MKNRKPEKFNSDECMNIVVCRSEDVDKYLEELLAGLKKAHEMGQIKGDWSDTQCDNFFTVLIKENEKLAKELGWDDDK